MELNGWQRLWVILTVIYMFVIVAYSFVNYPNSESIKHDSDYHKSMSAKSIAMITNSEQIIEASASGKDDSNLVSVEFANGHKLYLNKNYPNNEMDQFGKDYWTVIESKVPEHRKKFIFYMMLGWIVPCCTIYGLGWSFFWISSGFKSKQTNSI